MKTVCIDIDETCFSIMKATLPVYNFIYEDNLEFDDIVEYDITKFIKPECTHYFKRFCSPHIFTRGKLFEGCVETITKLNERYNVYWATAGYPETMAHRDEMLSNHFNWYTSSKLIMIKNKSLLKADLLIDDYVENLRHGEYEKLLFDNPWNTKFDEKLIGAGRMFKWDDESYRQIVNILG